MSDWIQLPNPPNQTHSVTIQVPGRKPQMSAYYRLTRSNACNPPPHHHPYHMSLVFMSNKLRDYKLIRSAIVFPRRTCHYVRVTDSRPTLISTSIHRSTWPQNKAVIGTWLCLIKLLLLWSSPTSPEGTRKTAQLTPRVEMYSDWIRIVVLWSGLHINQPQLIYLCCLVIIPINPHPPPPHLMMMPNCQSFRGTVSFAQLSVRYTLDRHSSPGTKDPPTNVHPTKISRDGVGGYWSFAIKNLSLGIIFGANLLWGRRAVNWLFNYSRCGTTNTLYRWHCVEFDGEEGGKLSCASLSTCRPRGEIR